MSDGGKKRIAFISYGGNIDAQIAKLLCDFLVDFFGYKEAVYCTATCDYRTAVLYGENFSDSYMQNLEDASIFIPLLSENYMQSKTALIEMGAAYALKKAFIPFLVSGCDYDMLQPLYNIRNNNMYTIEKSDRFRSAMDAINAVLKTTYRFPEEKYPKFLQNILKLKTAYKTNIFKQKQVKFICSKLFNDVAEYNRFIKELGNRKIIDITITNYSKGKISECSFYFKDTKNVSDLVNYIKEWGILEDEYDFVEIEV